MSFAVLVRMLRLQLLQRCSTIRWFLSLFHCSAVECACSALLLAAFTSILRVRPVDTDTAATQSLYVCSCASLPFV